MRSYPCRNHQNLFLGKLNLQYKVNKVECRQKRFVHHSSGHNTESHCRRIHSDCFHIAFSAYSLQSVQTGYFSMNVLFQLWFVHVSNVTFHRTGLFWLRVFLYGWIMDPMPLLEYRCTRHGKTFCLQRPSKSI